LRVKNDTLYADEVVLIVCPRWWGCRVVDSTIWWVVDLYAWVRNLGAVGGDLCYGMLVVGACVGVVGIETCWVV
jgi:hypothetical protein